MGYTNSYNYIKAPLALIIAFALVFWWYTPQTAHAALDDALIVYYELEESSGTRVDSHSTNDLDDNNTVTSATGIQGTAGQFTQANAEFLSIDDGSQATKTDALGDISVQLWLYPDSAPGTNVTDQVITHYNGVTATDRPWVLNYRNAAGTLRLQWDLTEEDQTEHQCRVNVDLGTGGWKHVVVTYDDSGGGTQEIYVDGSSIGSCTSVGNFFMATGGCFAVGARSNDGSCSVTNPTFDGRIDEVAVWGRALSSSEVTELWNSGSGLSYSGLTGGAATPSLPPKQNIIHYQ